MGKLQPAEYYDGIYANPKFGYQKHWSESHYRRLWAAVISLMSDLLIVDKNAYILELGCGPGQFASMLFEKLGGQDKFFHYRGLDFSAEAIKIAEKVLPNTYFRQADCLDPRTYKQYDANGATIIVAMEIFEHTDDLKILSLIPPGKQILVTVPDFDDPAHVRHFKTEEEVRNRYSNFVEIGNLKKFERWYIMTGKVREAILTK